MAGLSDAQLREVFDLFDANGDGSIDNEEMGLVLEALGFGKVDDDDLRSMIAEVDVDFSGKMEFDEFKFMVKKRAAPRDSREEVAMAFGVFAGKNDDGTPKEFISTKDLASVALSINEHVDMNKFQELLNTAPGMPIGKDEDGNSKGLTIVQWRELMTDVQTRKYAKAFQVKSK
eukprot:TRINITY_DN50216_c0_g1_i1.p2 TRINITY_DN50216_c0_g1~~TRINITY_DN50216_c0_g1_i1.p2  ORF type:complete len:174 (+),score=90.39 TRINITY_DN50216_c0_g1_i1:62-583(+)